MKTVHAGPENWSQTLPILLAVLECGTDEGKRIAKEELRRMAKVADLAIEADNNKRKRKAKRK